MEPHVEPLLQRYPFVSKLSGGGVVVRVLKTTLAPTFRRPLWGKFFGDSFHFARIPRERTYIAHGRQSYMEPSIQKAMGAAL